MEGFVWCPHCGSPHGLGTPSCPTTGQPLSFGHAAERALGRGELIAKRYAVRSWIGQDSVAFLYEAKSVNLGRRVLVKHVDARAGAVAEREAALAEMEREAVAASKVEHPNVLDVLDFERLGKGEGLLVRPSSSRARLASLLRERNVLEVADAGDLLRQILSGLHAIHRAGIVHCDLGPHNVVVMNRAGCGPIARIAGLGRCSAPQAKPHAALPSDVHYASPELLRGEAVGEASDLFSCGAMLFEMLTGRPPFEGATEEEVKSAVLRGRCPSVSKIAPGLSRAWSHILDRALDPDPARRFRSALELQRALPPHVGATESSGLAMDGARADIATIATLCASTSASRPPPSVRRGAGRDPNVGRRLANKYRIEAILGSGSAGAVYKATHIDLRRSFAVKILHDWNRSSRQFVERFKSEALAASKLDHPHLTRVLDCGQEPDGTLYLVMEYVEGRGLDAVIAELGRLSPVRAVHIALQLVGALAYAHAAGIIHRDIKPENIMLLKEKDEDGAPRDHAKLCDFGLAKLSDREMEEGRELTRAGLLLGSPAYMAPEQIRGLPCDARTDVYGIGVTLFEMLTGRLPHEAASMDELFAKKLNEPPCRPSTLIDGAIDPLLEDVVLHALEADPVMRHASAREMCTELTEVLDVLHVPSATNAAKVSIWPSMMPPPLVSEK